MTENMSAVDLKSLLEKRHRDKLGQDDKTEREQLLRKRLDNYIPASSMYDVCTADNGQSASGVNKCGNKS